MKKLLIVVLVVCILCGCGGREEIQEENVPANTGYQPTLNENGREEIILSASSLNVTLQEIISSYNKQSDRYEIVPVTFDSKTSWDDQRSRIQLEVTSGSD